MGVIRTKIPDTRIIINFFHISLYIWMELESKKTRSPTYPFYFASSAPKVQVTT